MNEKEALEKVKQIRHKENERLASMTEEERKEDYKKTNREMIELAKQIGIPVVDFKNTKK